MDKFWKATSGNGPTISDLTSSFQQSIQQSNESIPSISMPSISMSGMGKKMGGMGDSFGSFTQKMSNMSKEMTISLPLSITMTKEEKTAKLNAEKAVQVSQLLEDVRLLCPSMHSGIVVAYSTATTAPLSHPGIKFTWYRTRPNDEQFHQVDKSFRSSYPPSADDIGCKICAQCEDNFDQGLSRYVECGPIKADPMLCSLTESALDNNYFDLKNVSVSLGLHVLDLKVADGCQDDTPSSGGLLITDRPSVLTRDSSFIQLDRRSTVEVDQRGIFISITTTQGASPRGMRIPASEGLVVECSQPASLVVTIPITRKGVPSPVDRQSVPSEKAKLNGILKSKQALESFDIDSEDNESDTSEEGDEFNGNREKSSTRNIKKSHINHEISGTCALIVESDEVVESRVEENAAMEVFLSSSIVAIPWTYEGVHSPEAIIGDDGGVGVGKSDRTNEEIEILKQEAEQDAVSFANTVCALAEFMSSLPDGTKELKICFACGDRSQRDVLALSIRMLCIMPTSASKSERMRILPWMIADASSMEESGNKSVTDNACLIAHDNVYSSKDKDTRLKALEEDFVNLKRERDELTFQIMELREMNAISKQQQSSSYARTLMQSQSAQSAQSAAPTCLLGSLKNSSVDETEIPSTQRSSDSNDVEGDGGLYYPGDVNLFSGRGHVDHSDCDDEGSEFNELLLLNKQLTLKVVELENKVIIAGKKEGESSKVRKELEARIDSLGADIEDLKYKNDDANTRCTSLQIDNEGLRKEVDRKVILIRELQEQSHANKDLIGRLQPEVEKHKKNADRYKCSLEKVQAEMPNIISTMDTLKNEVTAYEELCRQQVDKIKTLETQTQHMSTIVKERNSLSEAVVALTADVTTLTHKLEDLPRVSQELEEANERIVRLQGEVKYLQRKSDSQGKDLKKYMKDNALVVAEFDKALLRKSEECNELQHVMNMMRDAEKERLEQERINEQSLGDSIASAHEQAHKAVSSKFMAMSFQLPNISTKFDPISSFVSSIQGGPAFGDISISGSSRGGSVSGSSHSINSVKRDKRATSISLGIPSLGIFNGEERHDSDSSHSSGFGDSPSALDAVEAELDMSTVNKCSHGFDEDHQIDLTNRFCPDNVSVGDTNPFENNPFADI